MGLRMRGGRRGHYSENSSLTQYISARGRPVSTGNRTGNTHGSKCAPRKEKLSIHSNSEVVERRKRNEALNQSVLRTFDQHKSVVEEEQFSRNLNLELEKTMNGFDVDTLASKSSPNGDKGSKTEILSKMEGSGLETPINRIMGKENGCLPEKTEGTDRGSSSCVKLVVDHPDDIYTNKSTSEIQSVHSESEEDKGIDTRKNAISLGKDHLNSRERGFVSNETIESISVAASESGPLSFLRSENFYAKRRGLNQLKMTTMGQQKGYKFLNKLSKRNRLNFYKFSSVRNIGNTKMLRMSFCRDLINTPKSAADDNNGRNTVHFLQKSPKKYLNSYSGIIKFVKDMDLESCPGTSSGNKVITSGDMSTLPMILRNSVMTQNSDSEKDDDEDMPECNILKGRNDLSEVVDVIDGIEFVTFENEHDMVQFTRLASDESCKGDLNDLAFSSEFPEAIIPKKTKDIKKIKGWQKKKFTVTQNPMLDPNSPSESELTIISNLCPEIIEYEHNYMRRNLENKLEEKEDYTDCEDELSGLPLDGSNFSVIENDNIRKLGDGLVERDKEDKISVWKPSEKSAFVSFSASNSDALNAPKNDDETGSGTSSEGAFINQLKDPTKLSTCIHSEQQSAMDHASVRSIATLSPTSIIMNKMKRRNAMLKAKIIKFNKSVQVDLPSEEDAAHKKSHTRERISVEELCEWSQPFEDIWLIDKKRALFAVSAVHSHSFLMGKQSASRSTEVPELSNTTLLLKKTCVPTEADHQLPLHRRLLRSSTKKKAAPLRMTRSSVSASQLEFLGTPIQPCISKSSNQRKSNASHSYRTFPSEKQVSGYTPTSQTLSPNSATTPSKTLPADTSVNNIDISSSCPLDKFADEDKVKTLSFDSSQALSLSRTLDAPSSSREVDKKSIQLPDSGSIKHLSSEVLHQATSPQLHPGYHMTRKEKRRLIAKNMWNVRKLRKLQELGILNKNVVGEFNDLVKDDLKNYSCLKSHGVNNGSMQTTEGKCDGNEIAETGITCGEKVNPMLDDVESCEKRDNEKKGNRVENVNITYGNSLSPVSWGKNAKQSFQGNGNRPELENEELTVFLKPKPRPQAESLCPMKSSIEPSVFFTGSNSKIDINHPLELSPPKKREVEIIKSKSPSSPSLSRKKLIRELQKLNANFVSVDSDKKDGVKDNCPKEFCRLGCVCDSIKTDKRLVDHCGKVECMFSCICPSNESASCAAKQLVIGSDTVSRLQEESSRHMAKVERYFHHTVVEAAGELVLPGRQQRERRVPKRFLDESIVPEVPLNPKKPKTLELCTKATVNQAPSSKKLLQSQSSPQYKKCSVNLDQFSSLQASVRCIFHSRLNCPCLTFSTGKVTRNVAMKSTTQGRGKYAHLRIGPAVSVSMEDLIIPEMGEQKVSSLPTDNSSFCESSDETSGSGIISENKSIKSGSNKIDDEELKGCATGGKNGIRENVNPSDEKIIMFEPHEEDTLNNTSEKDRRSVDCSSNHSDHCSIDDQDLQCSRTAGIDFWVSQQSLEKPLPKSIKRVNKAPRHIPDLVDEEPKEASSLAREVPKDSLMINEDTTEAAPRVEGESPEAALQVEEVTPLVVPEMSMDNCGNGSDLSDLVRQDDLMPLFKIVEVKSLPPSSFESGDSTMLTESDQKDVADEVRESSDNFESFNTFPLNTNASAEDKLRVTKIGTPFPSLECFDLWLTSNKALCGDLERMCSKSLTPLPLNSVIIMKWSHLNKLVQCHSAHLWMRQRFGTNSSSNSQVFITQKDKPPDAACVNFLDLEKKGALCTKVAILLRNSKRGDSNAKGCSILISKGCFWEISGHITPGRTKRNDLRELIPGKDLIEKISSSASKYKLKTKNENAAEIVCVPSIPVSKKFHKSTAKLYRAAEASLNSASSTLKRNAPPGITTKPVGSVADCVVENSDLSESSIRVELDLETSMFIVSDNQQNLSKSLKPNCNLSSENFDCDFGKYSMKERSIDFTASGNEILLSHRQGHLPTKHESGASERSSPVMADSLLNLERVPGTLNNPFLKRKQLSKVDTELQSLPPTLTGSGQTQYVVSENIACTSSFLNQELFSPSLEPPPHILQYEDVEPAVEYQHPRYSNPFDSPKKSEESNLKLHQSERSGDLQSVSCANLNSRKTNDHSSVTSDGNSIQEAKGFNSSVGAEVKGSPPPNTSSGNSFSGAKPVLIIDLKNMRQGHPVPPTKNAPVAIKIADIKSLSQGFDAKTRIDTSENIPPIVPVNSIPQVPGPLFPTVLHSTHQSVVAQEKILSPRAMPLQYSVCKEPLLFTCPSSNLPAGPKFSSKAIHVNIIKEMSPVNYLRKILPLPDKGNSFNVSESGERISSESETHVSFLGKKLGASNVKQRKSTQEEKNHVSNHTFTQIDAPLLLVKEGNQKLDNKVSVGEFTTDLNYIPSGQISTKTLLPKEGGSIDKEMGKCSLVPYNMQECTKVTPPSKDQVISDDLPRVLTEIRKESKTSSKTLSVQSSSVPKETKQRIFLRPQETLLEGHVTCNENENSLAKSSKSALKVLSQVMKGASGTSSARFKKSEQFPSFNEKEGLREVDQITEKQSECDDVVKSGSTLGQDSSTSVSKSGSEYKASKFAKSKEILLKNSPSSHGTSKSFSPSKKVEVRGSPGGVKEKETVMQYLHHSLSSSCEISTSKTQSLKNTSKKISPQSSRKVSTQSPNMTSDFQINNDVAVVSNSPSSPEETEPDILAQVKEKASVTQQRHHSGLHSGDTLPFKSQSLEDNSTGSLKGTSNQSPKKALSGCNMLLNLNSDMNKASKLSLSSSCKKSDARNSSAIKKNISAIQSQKVSSDYIVLPAINQDGPKASESLSLSKGTVVPNPEFAAKEKQFKCPSKQFSPCKTSVSKNQSPKKVAAVSVSPPNISALNQKTSSAVPLASKSSDVVLSPSVVPSSCEVPEVSTKNDVIWYRLDLNGEFDKLTFEETGFSTSSSRLISAVMIAKTSNRTVRLVFDKNKNTEDMQEFKRGIYAVPTVNGTYVKIGPYKHNEPTGIKTLKKKGNRQFQNIPNLLRVDLDTLEDDGVVNDENEVTQRNESSEPKDNPGRIKPRESKSNDFASPKNCSAEGGQVKCKSPRSEVNDKCKSPIEVHKNAVTFSSETGTTVKNHLGLKLKIPLISLPRLSIDADCKKQNKPAEQKKLIDDIPLPKRSKVAKSDANPFHIGTKCDEDDSENSLVGVRSSTRAHDDRSSIVQTAKCQEDSAVGNAGTVSSDFCNASGMKMACDSNERGSLICDKDESSASVPFIQVNEGDGLTLKITNVTGNYQFEKGIEENQVSVEGTKSANVVEKAKLPPSTPETEKSNEFLKDVKGKIYVARKSTVRHAFMEKTLITQHERMDVDMKAEVNGKVSSEKSSWKRKVVIPPLITLKESDIQSEEMYECGYLIPDNPKLAPIPAKKCLMPSESSAIIFEDPARPGVYVKFEDIGDISNYIEHNLPKHIRCFPSDLEIKWTYSNHKPSTLGPGLIDLIHLPQDTELTQPTKNEDGKPMNEKVVEEIEDAKVQILSLISPNAKSSEVNCEVNTKGLGEISFLQSHRELLSQSNVDEKKRKLQLDEKLRGFLKVETFSEFIDEVSQLENSLSEDLGEKDDADKNSKDLRKSGKCSRRGRGRGAGKQERTGDNGSSENICQADETNSTNSKKSDVKEVSSDAVPLPNGRVLRSSRNSKSSVELQEISDKSVPEVNQSNSSSSSPAVNTSSSKGTVSEKITSASPDTVRKLISSIVDSGHDNKSDNLSSDVMNGANGSCSSERAGSQASAAIDEKGKSTTDEVKPVDALLWKKSFSKVKIDKISLRSGTKDSSAETSAPKRQFLRRKIDQKQRASRRGLEASTSTSHPLTSILPSKKRRS